MARRRRKIRGIKTLKDLDFSRPKFDVPVETKKSIIAIILILLGAVSLLALFNLAGTLGVYLDDLLKLALGAVRWLSPILFLILGYFLLRPAKYKLKFSSYFGLGLFIFSFTGLVHLIGHSKELSVAARTGQGGGYIGLLFSSLFLKMMGFWVSILVMLALVLIGLFLLFNTSFTDLSEKGGQFKSLWQRLNDFFLQRRVRKVQREKERAFEQNGGMVEQEPEFSAKEVEIIQEPQSEFKGERKRPKSEEEQEAEQLSLGIKKFKSAKVDLPLDLLTGKTGTPNGGDIEANKLIIKKTLENFGIDVEMGEAQVGPTVTQYTLKPAEGVKLSRITSLTDNLALALASHPIRMEAPIPGRSLVGIEVPNTAKAIVPLRDILFSDQFKNRRSNLMVALGKDVMGRPWLADLQKMPHLLIAGATGSGKSVCINAIILSLLFQNSPGDLKFIMVDPKRVELPLYNGIPHLLTPVVTDVKKTVNSLRWAITEMERRFEILSQSHKRNLEAYNAEMPEKIPYIIIVIDELADLMAAAAAEVEAAIIRLAQMSRAVGIHLVLATQRPSVDVLTGLIKANITSRIAFSVASLVDSRTILDMSGAEKLLGRGDMLYISADLGKPKRLQGAFASDEEIKRVIDYLKQQAEPEYLEEVIEKQQNVPEFVGSIEEEGGDPLLPEAKEVILQAKKASASLLQRRLRIGYARAARILDLLEDKGFIGAGDGAKPREILINNLEDSTIEDTSENKPEDQNLEG